VIGNASNNGMEEDEDTTTTSRWGHRGLAVEEAEAVREVDGMAMRVTRSMKNVQVSRGGELGAAMETEEAKGTAATRMVMATMAITAGEAAATRATGGGQPRTDGVHGRRTHRRVLGLAPDGMVPDIQRSSNPGAPLPFQVDVTLSLQSHKSTVV